MKDPLMKLLLILAICKVFGVIVEVIKIKSRIFSHRSKVYILILWPCMYRIAHYLHSNHKIKITSSATPPAWWWTREINWSNSNIKCICSVTWKSHSRPRVKNTLDYWDSMTHLTSYIPRLLIIRSSTCGLGGWNLSNVFTVSLA